LPSLTTKLGSGSSYDQRIFPGFAKTTVPRDVFASARAAPPRATERVV
jgi:hypothetical protein